MITIRVKPIGQGTHQGCWLACYKMLYAYRRKSTSTIEKKLTDAGLNVKECKAEGLSDKHFLKAMRALGLSSRGIPFGAGSCDILAQYLWKHGPLWVAGKWTQYHHVVLVVGADPEENKIRRIDPWVDRANRAEARWMDFGKFYKGVKKGGQPKGYFQHWDNGGSGGD